MREVANAPALKSSLLHGPIRAVLRGGNQARIGFIGNGNPVQCVGAFAAKTHVALQQAALALRFVERQVPTPEYRGYLAAAPMHDATAASPAGPLLPEAPPAGAANDPEITVGVWALQPTVKGLLPAGSTTQRAFRLTPLEGRVFLVD